MTIQWMTAALLSSALVVGCSDRGNDNAQNLGETLACGAARRRITVPPYPGAR